MPKFQRKNETSQRMQKPNFLDQPPVSDSLTDYDREHLKLYMRLLDADSQKADWQEVVSVLFGIDSKAEPELAQTVFESHLVRAKWMIENGYRQLLAD
jgi:hypothetical protein